MFYYYWLRKFRNIPERTFHKRAILFILSRALSWTVIALTSSTGLSTLGCRASNSIIVVKWAKEYALNVAMGELPVFTYGGQSYHILVRMCVTGTNLGFSKYA